MKTKAFITVIALALLSVNTFAQENESRFGVELNCEVSIVSTELNGANLNTGLCFETIFQYRFMPFTSVYGGWGYTHFNANESFAGTDIDFEQTGYILGLQLKNSIKESPLSYFVRGGLLYSHIETENNDGEIISDTGHGVGFQVAGGIEEEQLLEKSKELGEYIIQGLSNLISEKSIVKEVRGRGLMLAIELKRNAQQVYENLLNKGFIVAKRPNSEVLRMDPALTIERQLIDLLIENLKEIFEKNE